MKLNLLTVFLCAAVLVSGCGGSSESTVPDYVLPREKYIKLIVDFSLAESAANLNIKGVPIQKVDSVYHFNPLKENGVTKSQYDTTVWYYSQHPELNKEIYEEVLKTLSEMESARNEPQKKDSTNTQ